MKNIIIGKCILLSLLCIISDAARAATTEEIVPAYSQAPIEGNSGLSVSLYKRAWVDANNGSYKLTSQAYGACNADPLKRNTTQSIVAYMSASADRSTWPIVSKSYIETNPSASNLPDGHVRARRMRDPDSPKGQDWYYYFAIKTVGKSQVVYKAHTILWHVTGFLGPITPRWLGGKNTKRTFRDLTDTMQAEWTASSRSGLDTSVVPYAYGKITSYSSNTNGGTGIMISQVEADTTKNPDGTDNQYDSLSTNFRQAETVGAGKPIVVCPACEEVVTTERQHLVTCPGCGSTYYSCQSNAQNHVQKTCNSRRMGIAFDTGWWSYFYVSGCGKKYWLCSESQNHRVLKNPVVTRVCLSSSSGGSTPPATTPSGGGGGGGSGSGSGSGSSSGCQRGRYCDMGASTASSATAHQVTCGQGHTYWVCNIWTRELHQSHVTTSSSGGSDTRVACGNAGSNRNGNCNRGGTASSTYSHQTTCGRGHTYWGCSSAQSRYHGRH